MREYINDEIDDSWSPEQIYFRSKIENPPTLLTIYIWISLWLIIKVDMKKLHRKVEIKRGYETRGSFNNGKI